MAAVRDWLEVDDNAASVWPGWISSWWSVHVQPEVLICCGGACVQVDLIVFVVYTDDEASWDAYLAGACPLLTTK